MSKSKKQSESTELILDIGGAFTKIGYFSRKNGSVSLEGLQMLPSLSEGFFIDPPLGSNHPTLDPQSLLSSRSGASRVRVTTSRLRPTHLLIAGMTNDDIEDALYFCNHVGIEVDGVLSLKKMVRKDDVPELISETDGVLLIGGFERRKEKKLMELLSKLADTLTQREAPLPIFFIGGEELAKRVSQAVDDRHPVSLIPNQYPGKPQKNYLKLFVELSQIALEKAMQTDSVLRLMDRSDLEVDSGQAALLSALSILTEHWKANVLLIDVGSQKSQACWSYFSDDFSIPVWPAGETETLFEMHDRQQGQSQHYGIKVYDQFGLGGSVQEAIRELSSEELAAVWPAQELQGLKDRVLNHSLYPAVIPDEVDSRWQNLLLRILLDKVWRQLPLHYQPGYVVLSGAYFGLGSNHDALIDDVLLPSGMPFSAKIWTNRGPVLPLLGMLRRDPVHTDRIGPEQFLAYFADYVKIEGRGSRRGVMAEIGIDTNQEAVETFEVKRGETHIVGVETRHQAMVRIQPFRKARIRPFAKGEEVLFTISGSQKGLIIDGRNG